MAVYAVTGTRSIDDWGAVYIVDVEFGASTHPTAVVSILHDGNLLGDSGIRNPDNVDWADNGRIYVQEDPSHEEFGADSGRDASVIELDPESGAFAVIAEMIQSATFPHPIGEWEPSGVLDVTGLFGRPDGEVLLAATVQAHGLDTGAIAEHNLVEGGQLLWIRSG
jgi:hypothetical protein